MKISTTHLSGVMLIEPKVFGDERGFFLETYQSQRFAEAGLPTDFVQDNHSGSGQGVLRGLHYQLHQAQGKLVRVISGEIFDVAVDLRKSSPTFAQWEGFRLSAQNKLQIWIPPGFAHGFYVISEWSEIVYKATQFYSPEWERTLLWNDPALAIAWPLTGDHPPILSPKDSQGISLAEADLYD